MSVAIINRGTRAAPSYVLLRDGQPFGPLAYARRPDALDAVRVLRDLPPSDFEGACNDRNI